MLGLLLGLSVVIGGAALPRLLQRTSVSLPDAPDGRETWLIIGSDQREAAAEFPNSGAFGSAREVPGERADVLLLAQARSGGSPSQLVSIPRDLVVFRKGVGGADRLALTLLDSLEGPPAAICRSLGVAVNHVAVVRFDGVARLVDELGGLDVDSERRVRDRNTGLSLEAGTNHLAGWQAIAWVRSRHIEEWRSGTWTPVRSGDKGRQGRQRLLLEQVFHKARQAMAGTRAPAVARALTRSITVDADAKLGDLVRLAATLRAAGSGTSLPNDYSSGPIPVAQLNDASLKVLGRLRDPDAPSTCPPARVQTAADLASATAPGAPEIASAVTGDGKVTLTWQPPVDRGGSAITAYLFVVLGPRGYAVGDTAVFSGSVTSGVIDGLTNGTAYSFRVAAINHFGTGRMSERTPTTMMPPSRPPNPRAAVLPEGDRAVQVSWDAPVAIPGGEPSSYVVIAYCCNGTGEVDRYSFPATSTTQTITGLQRGVSYSFRVAAVNQAGTGGESALSNSLVLPLGRPGPVSGLSVAARGGGAFLTWRAPLDDGGSGITAYVVSVYGTRGVTRIGSITVAAPAMSTQVTGYPLPAALSFRVAAVNREGVGPASPLTRVS